MNQHKRVCPICGRDYVQAGGYPACSPKCSRAFKAANKERSVRDLAAIANQCRGGEPSQFTIFDVLAERVGVRRGSSLEGKR